MSNFSKLFSKAPTEVPKFSGFDMSHINIGTMKVGTLVPVLVEPLYPNDKISVGANLNVQLPPMASDFIGKVDLRMEAFFVPYRILWQGWQRFYNFRSVDTYVSVVDALPKIVINDAQYNFNQENFNRYVGSGTLMDYLGFKINRENISFTGNFELKNPLPFLAYHMIYDRWYRDKTIQRPCFASPDEISNMINSQALEDDKEKYSAAMMPYRYGGDGINSVFMPSESFIIDEETGDEQSRGFADYLLADGHCLFDLRQRNWSKDYFTIATPYPQAGEIPAKVVFNSSGATAEFTIAALRAANSLQKFAEKRNIAGGEYDEQILADWGVRPSDSVIQHPIYIGSFTQSVYNRSVLQSANGIPTPIGETAPYSRNPFAQTVGAAFGKSSVLGSDSIIKNFRAKEHGLIMILASIVPHAFYGSGTRKYLNYSSFSDFPNPNFVAIGDQEIKEGEITDNSAFFFPDISDERTFGYTQRYAEKKFHLDEVHGLLRDGQSLQHFAVQRTFDDVDSISTEFIQIGTDALDNVSAIEGDISNFGAWYEIAFKEQMVSAFPQYSIPTLGDEKHTSTIIMDKGGKRL